MRVKNFKMRILISLLTILCLSSCSEINTTIPSEVFKYWSGTNASTDLELLKGQYWQSSHLTKEYIMYLKLKPSDKWWNEFIKQNQLSVDKRDWITPSNMPIWFNPSENSIRFSDKSDFDQGSRYFKDTLTGVCYIYEIQL